MGEQRTISAIFKIRSDTSSNWSTINPVLLNGEVGYDTTNKKFKVGDGSTNWSNLSYVNNDNLHKGTSSSNQAETAYGRKTFANGITLSGSGDNNALILNEGARINGPSNRTVFGFNSDSTGFLVNHPNYKLILRGSTTRPYYITSGSAVDSSTETLALYSDLADLVDNTSLSTTLAGYVQKVSSTDNAIARYDGTDGTLQNSKVTIADSGSVTIGGTWTDTSANNPFLSMGGYAKLTGNTSGAFTFAPNNVPSFLANTTEFRPISSTANAVDLGSSSYGFRYGYFSTGIQTAQIYTTGSNIQRISAFHAGTASSSTTYTYTLPDATGTLALTSDIPSVSGYVSGPASSTDNAIARYDGATGKIIQNSSVTIDDNGNLSLGENKYIYLGGTNKASYRANANGAFIIGAYSKIHFRGGLNSNDSSSNANGVTFDAGTIAPEQTSGTALGTSTNKWTSLYVTKLNNGADITVPNANGTMALVSDILTNTNQLTNGAGFITASDLPTNHVTTDTAQDITGQKTIVGQTRIKGSAAASSADNTTSGFQFWKSTTTSYSKSSTDYLGLISANDNGAMGFYGRTALFFRPVITNGSVDTNYGVTMNSTGLFPGSTSMPLGNSSSPWGQTYTNQLKITSSDMINHIEFARNGWNYIVAAGGSSGAFGFVAAGKSASGANSTLAIAGDTVLPGLTDNTVSLGGAYSNNVYHFKDLYMKGKICKGQNTYTLPSVTGTLALTSQIPDDYVDLSTNQTIEGVKTFTNRPRYVATRLPETYQEVESLIFDGSSGYVDTGLVITKASDLTFIMSANLRAYNSNKFATLFGFMASGTTPRCAVSIYTGKYMIGIDATTSSSVDPTTGIHNYKFYTSGSNQVLEVDGSSVVSTTYSSSALNNNVLTTYVGARNSGGTANNFSDITVYSFKITHNGNSYNYVPCYRVSDDKPGFYDTINEEFYPAAGGVTVGDNVEDSEFLVASDLSEVATSGSYNDLKDKPTAADFGLSGAMKFLGTTTTSISDGSTTSSITISGSSHTAQSGEVVLYNNKEFVWTGSAWEILGDEGSYALKTITITGTGALSGGGTLEQNRTITHNEVLGTAESTAAVYKITMDKYGHVASKALASAADLEAQPANDVLSNLAAMDSMNQTGLLVFDEGEFSLDTTSYISVVKSIKTDYTTSQTASSGETLAGSGTIALHKISKTGSYNDLLDTPSLFSGNYNDLTNKPTLFSGSYNDLTNKPTLFSGNYNDLTNKPTIPTVNNATLTITQNNVSAGTFTANASSNVTIDIETPQVMRFI